MIIEGIEIGRKYPAEEILKMWEEGRLRKVTLRGYAARSNGDGTCSFVPWYESRMTEDEVPGLRGGAKVYGIKSSAVQDMAADIEREHPIVRRTPQQRVGAMVLRLMAEAKKYGGIPGLSQEQVKAIMGEYWKVGDPVTEESVRRVAAHYLGIAEAENRERDSHNSTRKYPTA